MNQLNLFCNKYTIIPKDVQALIREHFTLDERKLIGIYNDEITHLDNGRNLAMASDILRWLKSVYILGTYSDFDVHVDTSMLQARIFVNKPPFYLILAVVLYKEMLKLHLLTTIL